MDVDALRGYLARILGWSAEQAPAVERALLAIRLSITHYAALVLLGDSDLVPIAQALHRRTLGAERPFVLCDPRRVDTRASVRSAMSRGTGVAAFEAARDGTLCARLARLPSDFSEVVARAREPATDVRIVICADARYDRHPFLANPPPIRVPSLAGRADELDRIVDEYAADAVAALGGSFTDEDRRWVLAHACETLTAIETATLRLVALRASRSTDTAGEMLGMAGAALRQWRSKRRRRGGSGVRHSAHLMLLRRVP